MTERDFQVATMKAACVYASLAALLVAAVATSAFAATAAETPRDAVTSIQPSLGDPEVVLAGKYAEILQSTKQTQSGGTPSLALTTFPASESISSSVYQGDIVSDDLLDALPASEPSGNELGEASPGPPAPPPITAQASAPLMAVSSAEVDVDSTLVHDGYYDRIRPTRTSGEAHRASRGRARSLLASGPVTLPNSEAPVSVSEISTANGSTNGTARDTANPDIRDVLTGIIKLLNGNVNVAGSQHPAVKSSRPPRPVGTRINNRGPPRLPEMPPLPAQVPLPPPLPPGSPQGIAQPGVLHSTRIPPPYPFDMPAPIPLPPQPEGNHPTVPFVAGVPLPEQKVPLYTTSQHPSGPQIEVRPMTKPNGAQPQPPPVPPPPPPPPPPSSPSSVTTPISPDEFVSPTSSSGEPPAEDPEVGPNPSADPLPQPEASPSEVPEPAASSPEPSPSPEPSSSPSPKPVRTQPDAPSTNPSPSPEPKPSPTPTEKTKPQPPAKPSGNTKKDKERERDKSKLSEEENMKVSPSVTILQISTTSTTQVLYATEAPTVGSKPSSATPLLASPSAPSHGIIESSMVEIGVSQDMAKPTTRIPVTPSPVIPPVSHSSAHPGRPYRPYRPRPGLVLDDTEYRPGRPSQAIQHTQVPHYGEVFDVTVSAVQGPGSGTGSSQGGGQPGTGPLPSTGHAVVYPVEIEGVQVGGGLSNGGRGDVVITAAQAGQHFVSIDGKRTYINLFNTEHAGGTGSVGVAPSAVAQSSSAAAHPPASVAPSQGVGSATPESAPIHGRPHAPGPGHGSPPPRRPYNRRPTHPPVRIDTCIVGDDSTCDSAQNEACRTEVGVSACHCRPGYSRRKHREPCRRVVSLILALRVDRMYDNRVLWTDKFKDPHSDEFQQLEYEAVHAIDSAMSMTPFSDEFMGARVNRIFVSGGGLDGGNATERGVFVNATLQLEEAAAVTRPGTLAQEIQKHLLGVLHRRHNNIGASALWVDNPAGAVQHLVDVDECSEPELHDCHAQALCTNVFGTFRCACKDGLRDPWNGNPHRSGRKCETCAPEHCNNRGECRFENGAQVCHCTGNFYGAQCEVDGEVLGVAVGASVAAVVIIVLTLVCLCMWSRRWSREQKSAVGLGYGSPVFGYLGGGGGVKTPAVGAPPYQVTLEERLRWAQIADAMAQASNHYAQPEPISATRPSSAMFGYPSLSMAGTLPPPVPLPRLSLGQAASTYGIVQPPQQPGGGGGGANSLAHTLKSQRGRSTLGRTADNTSSSDEEDRTDLLGRNFHVPRPKSRSSLANQSGIYYDVDYEAQGDIYGTKPSCIPLSTYSSRPHYYRQ